MNDAVSWPVSMNMLHPLAADRPPLLYIDSELTSICIAAYEIACERKMQSIEIILCGIRSVSDWSSLSY